MESRGRFPPALPAARAPFRPNSIGLRQAMKLHWTDLPATVLEPLRRGSAIPAHPLALDENRRLDRERQRALTRYYVDAGSGGHSDYLAPGSTSLRNLTDIALGHVSEVSPG